MAEQLKKYRCGIAPWRETDAVFAAVTGWGPATTYHEFRLIDCAPRDIMAEDAFEAAQKFIFDIELPFGNEIRHMLKFQIGHWALYKFSIEAEQAGEDPWIEIVRQ